MEENRIEKKSNTGLVVVIVILLLICLGLGGFVFVNKDKLFSSSASTKTQTVNEGEINKKLEINDSVRLKLNRFVEAGSVDIYGSVQTAPIFYDGKTELTENEKLIIAYADVFTINRKIENRVLTEKEIAGIDGLKPDNGEKVTILKISDYEKAYKDLFGENGDVKKAKDLGIKLGCPAPLGIDTKAGNMYLYSRCGGATDTKYSKEITSYDSDTEYYYVHQTMKYESPETTKEYKIVWKFDKNIKFVSAEKED